MKTLRHALIDYELPMLKAIADCRAVLLDASDQTGIMRQLVETLQSPVATAIAVEDLSESEREALEFILKQGGVVEGPRFSRHYGEIRMMGSARLERERPWENPATPAEGLWYRGLIFKTFQVTDQGTQEIVYVPQDLLPFINIDSENEALPQPTPQLVEPTPPVVVINSRGHLRENLFRLLVYLQTTTVRIQADSQIPPQEKQTLTEKLLPPLHPAGSKTAELDFLLHLGRRADLLTVRHGQLRPNRQPVRDWLQATAAQQMQTLQSAWRTDHTWNELWRVPGLAPQPTGWENSPLLARSKILEHLGRIKLSVGAWMSIDQFVTLIKQTDPDFQRPKGDYESWYIQDAEGNFLMGFEHWDQVEGALIRYLLTFMLPLLEVVDVGYKAKFGPPSSIRLTPLGAIFFGSESDLDQNPPQRFLRVDNNFQTHVSVQASLYDRFQLARFAHLEQYDAKKTVYQITRASVRRAFKNGVTPDQITAFLARATNNQAPLKVIEAIRNWGSRFGTVQLEPVTLLNLKQANIARELRQHPELNALLGESLNPTTILVPNKNVAQVRRILIELGYLE